MEKEVNSDNVTIEKLKGEVQELRTDRKFHLTLLVISLVGLGAVVGVALWKSDANTRLINDMKVTVAERNECRLGWGSVGPHMRELDTAVMTCQSQLDNCKDNPGCPPAPACPALFDEQIQAKIDACKVQLDEIQMRWDAKHRLAEEAIEAAKKLGVGPRLREWIADSEAQLAAREVLLSYQDWVTVNHERGEAAQGCTSQLFDTVRGLEVVNAYEALRSDAYNTQESSLGKKTEQLFPDWMVWRQMELDLTREAVGCKDEPEDRR